jgi:hypothetical protein
MKDGTSRDADDPEGRRQPGSGRRSSGGRRQRGSLERAAARGHTGHSGHGAESVRPYLREQLRLKSLFPSPFPVPEQEQDKDQHHR